MENQIKTNSASSKGKMRICHFSDSHGHHKELKIPECDLLICSGDISMIGERDKVESFFSWFRKQNQATNKVVVAGNHDITLDRNKSYDKNLPDWFEEVLERFESPTNIYLENDSCEILGVKIWGSPISSWFCGDRWAFNMREPQEEELYSQIPAGIDIVITHGPSIGYGDWCRDVSEPVGSVPLAYHLNRVRPLLHFFGHIHESYGYDYDLAAKVWHFNGSVCDLSYWPNNKPHLLDVDFDTRQVDIIKY